MLRLCFVFTLMAVKAIGAKETFDGSLYKIVWNDQPATQEMLQGHDPNVEDDTSMWIRTRKNESFFCKLPVIQGSESDLAADAGDSTTGLSPYKLLKPLITREVCSYRLEPYWTYELCHGKSLRQFHEESSINKVKGQEFILGKFDPHDLAETEEIFKERVKRLKERGKPAPTVVVEGVSLPYIEFNFTSGTLCDLNNNPRKTRVLYVCHEESKHELHSVKETFTCEYEAIILSPLLCLHKDYVIKTDTEIDINCYPLHPLTHDADLKDDDNIEASVDSILDPEKSLKKKKKNAGKPKDVIAFEERMEADAVQPEVPFFDGKTIILNAADGGAPGAPKVKIELRFHDEDGNELSKETFGNLDDLSKPIGVSGKILGFEEKRKPSVKKDLSDDVARDFLSGNLCLQGGTGWWKYEFCYGDRVEQYHEEDGKRSSTIILGRWDAATHTNWLKDHDEKRPKNDKTPKQVSHFYGNGDICDEIGRPRQVEVKLKCKYVEGHPESVALYLLEPKTCQYVLGIESPIICNLLSSVDSEGLMSLSSSASPSPSERTPEKEL